MNSVIKFSVGEEIEVMRTNGENLTVTVRKIVEKRHCYGKRTTSKQQLYIDVGMELNDYDILRRKEEDI